MHSSDKARRSLCIFSSSFFTASGLLVQDMVPPGPRRSGTGATKQALSVACATGSEPVAPQPSATGAQGTEGARPELGCVPRGVPELPPASPCTAAGCSPRPARSRAALPGSTGTVPGAHQTGRSLPLPQGPATAGVTGRAGHKLQRCPPRVPRLADAISRVAHNSERRPDTSAALPGSGPRPRPGQSGGEPLQGRGRARGSDKLQLGSADLAPAVHASGPHSCAGASCFLFAGW